MTGRVPRTALLVLALVWLAFALRAGRLDYQSLWRDEVDTLRFATGALSDLLSAFRAPGQNGPFFFLALRPWLTIAGQSEFALRFPAAWTGTLAVPVVYVLTGRLAGRRAGLVAAALAATAPYLVWYGQEAKMYAALTLLVPLSLWLTIEAAQRGGWWRWLLLYVVTSLCFYTHLLAALIVPVQVLWLLMLPTGFRPARRWATAGAYAAALVLPYLPLAQWQVDMLSARVGTGHPFLPLADILAVLAVAFSNGVLPVRTALSVAPAALALLAGVALWPAAARAGSVEHLAAGTRWRTVALLTIWLLLPPLATYAISLRVPVFADRYLIWSMPAYLALAGAGVVALAAIWRPLGLVAIGGVLLVNGMGVWTQGSRPVKSDFRAAAAFVLAHWQPGDLLIYQIPYIRYAFTYYTSRAGGTTEVSPPAAERPWMDGPYTNNGATEAAVADEMARGTAGWRAAWLVASEVPMWDARDLTRKWLSAHGTITHHADFTRVSVTRYAFAE